MCWCVGCRGCRCAVAGRSGEAHRGRQGCGRRRPRGSLRSHLHRSSKRCRAAWGWGWPWSCGCGLAGAVDRLHRRARETWHAEPAKVFDNLYYVGMTEYSAWAITTTQGIILIDAVYDYSVEDEVVEGLKKLGLNPADIKYVLISHGHLDHAGGAKLLQETVWRPHPDVGGRLGHARSAEPAVEAQARHGRDRRPAAHARRHHADDVHHAGAYAGDRVVDRAGVRQRSTAHGGRVGRHGVQLRARQGAASDLRRVSRAGSATSSRRRAPTCCLRITPTSTAPRRRFRRWHNGSRAVRIPMSSVPMRCSGT